MMTEAVRFYNSLCGRYPIRDAFQSFYRGYAGSRPVSDEQRKAAMCISGCKTGRLGYNISRCPECGHVEIHASSCNNRNCPCCQHPQEQKWVMARNSELIEGCAYYHVIFTVPSGLNGLIFENQKLLYNLMFSCASETLATLCRDRKYMGATPGIVTVLHTWGQKLNFHPHLHCCVSGGGLTPDGRFVESRHKGFALPVRAVGRMFRGKFMAKLKELNANGSLLFEGRCRDLRNSYAFKELVDSLYEKDWIPFVKETFNGNGNAIKYLARYAYRTAISNSRIVSVTGGSVSFRYKDYADGGKSKVMTVAGEDFIGLFLQHVLPKGFSRIRFSGFLSNCRKTENLKLIHRIRNTQYLPNPVRGISMADLMLALYGKDICSCPKCSGRLQPVARDSPAYEKLAYKAYKTHFAS